METSATWHYIQFIITLSHHHPSPSPFIRMDLRRELRWTKVFDDDDVYYYIRWRLKLEGETENMGVCTKERKGVTAAVLMATPCTNSLGGESGGQKHEGRDATQTGREKVDFIETTALRQRRNGGREVTVTSRLHRQKDKERQRKTEEKGEKRPVVAPGAGVRWRGSSTGAPGAGLRITVAKDLRGQGSRLSTGQAEGGPHAPEEAAPPPTVGFRVIIDDLVPIPVVTLSLVVGKEIQQAKKIPMNASGSGDHSRKESPAHIQCRVACPVLVNLLLCPVGEHMIDVRMTQSPIQRRVGSVAMKVVNPGNINAQPTADAADHHAREV